MVTDSFLGGLIGVIGEWDQFVYVSMIAAGGWIFHFVPFLIMVSAISLVLYFWACLILLLLPRLESPIYIIMLADFP